jgi:uncharacterized protein (DUF58 family)
LVEGTLLGQRYALAVPQHALAGAAGERLARRTGNSVDFQDYREYHPGDDPRTLDWAVYGRTDKLTVKLYRDEVTPHLDLILDASASMALAGSTKLEALWKLAALFVTAAENARCTRALWLAGDGFRRLPNDTLPPVAWGIPAFTSLHSLDAAFDILPPKCRRLGLRLLLSDLLWPGDPLATLRRLANGAAETLVIQLLAKADAEPPPPGKLRLEDSESGQIYDLHLDATGQRQYRDALSRHQEAWRDACRQTGARFATVIAEQLEESLPDLVASGALAPA